MSGASDNVTRPPFRPAEVITAHAAEASFETDDIERIYLALVDGSRCLSDEWAMSAGERFLGHENARVRWGALFALDQARAAIILRIRDDFEIIFRIGRLAWEDEDPHVRNMAVTTLQDIIGMMAR